MDRNRTKGGGNKIVGAIKQKLGKVTGGKERQDEGRTDKSEGKTQTNVGKTKDEVRKHAP